MHITVNVLADYKFLFNVDTCDEDHRIKNIIFVWRSTNTLLNIFVLGKMIMLLVTS